MKRPTIKGLSARVEFLEGEAIRLEKQAGGHLTELRHLRRELRAALVDLPPGQSRLGTVAPTETRAAAAIALETAESEWRLDVSEPGQGGAHSADRINAYIRSPNGLNWSDANLSDEGRLYERDGDFSWCGAFAAFCWSSVVLRTRKKTFPSTYRLWRDWQSRRVSPLSMIAGDIVVVFNTSASRETRERKTYGQHIVICRAPGAEQFSTWEGNARAEGPDGSWREGVGTRERDVADVAAVYRPQLNDLDGALVASDRGP